MPVETESSQWRLERHGEVGMTLVTPNVQKLVEGIVAGEALEGDFADDDEA